MALLGAARGSRPLRSPWRHFDWVLLGAAALLVVLGIAVIHSASRSLQTGMPLLQSFAGRQILWALVGFLGLLAMALIDYRVVVNLGKPLYLVAVAILILVYIAGQEAFGAQRWLGGSLLAFQPSELAKLLLIVSLAHFMGNHMEQMNRLPWIALSGLLVLPPMVLVYLQPDLSTTVLLGGLWALMVLAAGVRVRHVLLGALAAVVGAPFLWTVLQDYQRQRIIQFLDPSTDPTWMLGPGYNIVQARIAVGSGGWLGQGLGLGSQSQLHFLRVRHTDFVFSVLGEELGLAGAALLMVLVGVVLWRLTRAARMAPTPAGALIPVGVGALIFLQTTINVGMNVGLLPAVGLPLPFLTYGGSSLIAVLLGIGLVESVVLRHKKLEF